MYKIEIRPPEGHAGTQGPNPARLRSLAQLLIRLAREGAIDAKDGQPSPLFVAQADAIAALPSPWKKDD